MAHPKGVLIERLQKEGRQPRFETEIGGPDHEPVFDSEVFVGDTSLGTGHGPNKRTAERLAAEEALATLDADSEEDGRSETGDSGERDRDRGADRGPRRGRGGKRGGRKASEERSEAVAEPAPAPEPVASDAPFDGPWPVFDTVLATSLRIAHERVAVGLGTDDAREAIESFALHLYKNVLSDLGEVIEEEIEEPA